MAGVGRGEDSLLQVWSLHTGELILSREDYQECQVDVLVTVSDRQHDYLLVYFNIHEPHHRLHVFQVLYLAIMQMEEHSFLRYLRI